MNIGFIDLKADTELSSAPDGLCNSSPDFGGDVKNKPKNKVLSMGYILLQEISKIHCR